MSGKKSEKATRHGVILLAAGKAQRFGSDKRLALINGQALLQTSLQLYQTLSCELLLLLNAEPSVQVSDLVPPQVEILRAQSELDWGMGDSIALGAQYAIAQKWQYCLIALADMPYVQPATLQQLMAALSSHEAVVPSYQGQWGHPVGFGQVHFASLAKLKGDRGAKSVLRAAMPWVLDVDDPGVVKDIDVPADLQ